MMFKSSLSVVLRIRDSLRWENFAFLGSRGARFGPTRRPQPGTIPFELENRPVVEAR